MASTTELCPSHDQEGGLGTQDADWGDYGRQLDLDAVERVYEEGYGDSLYMTAEDWKEHLESDDGIN